MYIKEGNRKEDVKLGKKKWNEIKTKRERDRNEMKKKKEKRMKGKGKNE